MKIYVYPADEHGCGYHRLIWPAQRLKADGYDVEIIRPKDRGAGFQGVLDTDGNLVDVHVPSDAEVIVLQRITHKYIVSAIKILRQRGIAVVIDMDDNLSVIDPRNPAFMMMHPMHGKSKEHSWHNAQLACEAASLVTVSTDALIKQYAPHGRGVVLHNCIPQRYLDIPRVDSTTVGWGGSVHSHPDDLQTVGTAVAQIARENGPFRVVGPGEGVQGALGLDEPPIATGPLDSLVGWPRELCKLGIGIAPLADTRFNSAKSHLKPLEYAALGVPCVMSPRREYERIHKLGIGILARKPRSWLSELRKLIADSGLRAELSAQGRQVAGSLTVESNAWRWMEAWEQAYKIEH